MASDPYQCFTNSTFLLLILVLLVAFSLCICDGIHACIVKLLASGSEAETRALPAIIYLLSFLRHHWDLLYLTTLLSLMYSQTSDSDERKQQTSSFPSFQINKQRAAIWFSKPSFFRFKLKSGFLSHSSSSSSSSSSKSSKSSSSSSVSSLPQSPSTMTLKDGIYASTSVSNQAGVPVASSIKKSRQTLKAVPSKIEAPIAKQSTTTSKSIHSTAPRTTPHYRQQPIPNVLATITMVPGVCS